MLKFLGLMFGAFIFSHSLYADEDRTVCGKVTVIDTEISKNEVRFLVLPLKGAGLVNEVFKIDRSDLASLTLVMASLTGSQIMLCVNTSVQRTTLPEPGIVNYLTVDKDRRL